MPKGVYLHKKGYKLPPLSEEWRKNISLGAQKRVWLTKFNKKEWSKQYYLKNKEKMNAYSKEWVKKNRDKKKIINRRWRVKNPKKNRQLSNNWAKRNKEYVLHNASIQNDRRRGAKGSHTAKEWRELKEKLNYTCQRCGRKEPEIKLTKDHIIPISKGGDNYISNLQPLCKSCNCSKREFTN